MRRDGYEIPAYARMTVRRAGMTEKGVGSRFRGNDVATGGRGRRGATRPVYGAVAPEWIPSYAGMTKECTNVTMREDGMEVSEREQARRPETGRIAPRLQAIPGASSFPRKREPTGGRPLRASGNLPYRANGREIPAYAGMTGRCAPRPQAIPGATSFPRKREPVGGALPRKRNLPIGGALPRKRNLPHRAAPTRKRNLPNAPPTRKRNLPHRAAPTRKRSVPLPASASCAKRPRQPTMEPSATRAAR